MLIKIVIILFMLVILASLGSALFYLVRNRGDSKQMAKALTLRIGLSLGLFVLLLVAFSFGWITPHALT
jgi:hypothetical protein